MTVPRGLTGGDQMGWCLRPLVGLCLGTSGPGRPCPHRRSRGGARRQARGAAGVRGVSWRERSAVRAASIGLARVHVPWISGCCVPFSHIASQSFLTWEPPLPGFVQGFCRNDSLVASTFPPPCPGSVTRVYLSHWRWLESEEKLGSSGSGSPVPGGKAGGFFSLAGHTPTMPGSAARPGKGRSPGCGLRAGPSHRAAVMP